MDLRDGLYGCGKSRRPSPPHGFDASPQYRSEDNITFDKTRYISCQYRLNTCNYKNGHD